MSSKCNEVVTILIQQVIKARLTEAEYLAETSDNQEVVDPGLGRVFSKPVLTPAVCCPSYCRWPFCLNRPCSWDQGCTTWCPERRPQSNLPTSTPDLDPGEP